MQMQKSLILVVALLLAAPLARAEEDPVAPPSRETPKAPTAPKAPTPKAETPPVATPDAPNAAPEWSPPSTAARRDLPADNLPAPLVRDPRTGARLAGTGPARRTTPSNAAAADPLLGTGLPSAPTSSTPAVTTTPMAVAGAQIESIAKVHNLPLPTKKLALRLDVTFAIQGERGRAVYLDVDFKRLDTGEMVRSTLPVYAGPNGLLSVRTALSTVPVDAGRYAANVWVPYQAFPSPTGADMYTVEATVKLQRSESTRAPTTLTTATTTFNVHAPAPAAPALPEPRDLLPKAADVPLIDDGPLDIDDAPVEIDDPFAPPVAKGSPDGK